MTDEPRKPRGRPDRDTLRDVKPEEGRGGTIEVKSTPEDIVISTTTPSLQSSKDKVRTDVSTAKTAVPDENVTAANLGLNAGAQPGAEKPDSHLESRITTPRQVAHDEHQPAGGAIQQVQFNKPKYEIPEMMHLYFPSFVPGGERIKFGSLRTKDYSDNIENILRQYDVPPCKISDLSNVINSRPSEYVVGKGLLYLLDLGIFATALYQVSLLVSPKHIEANIVSNGFNYLYNKENYVQVKCMPRGKTLFTFGEAHKNNLIQLCDLADDAQLDALVVKDIESTKGTYKVKGNIYYKLPKDPKLRKISIHKHIVKDKIFVDGKYYMENKGINPRYKLGIGFGAVAVAALTTGGAYILNRTLDTPPAYFGCEKFNPADNKDFYDKLDKEYKRFIVYKCHLSSSETSYEKTAKVFNDRIKHKASKILDKEGKPATKFIPLEYVYILATK